MVLTTAENRNPGMSYHQRAELHKSRVADSGKFRIEEAIGKARRDALPAHQGTPRQRQSAGNRRAILHGRKLLRAVLL